jgi:signal peptidase II
MDAPQPAPETSRPFAMNRLLFIVPFTLLCLWWDLYSKSTVFERLGYPGQTDGRVYPLLGGWSTFKLVTSFNEGALWGVGQGLTWLFSLLSVVAVVAIGYWLIAMAGRSNWLTTSLCLVLAGTLGNLYDRLGMYGYLNPETGQSYRAVRDFLLFTFGSYSWPVFNFADVFLVTGTSMLVAYSFWAERSLKQQPASTISQPTAPPTT